MWGEIIAAKYQFDEEPSTRTLLEENPCLNTGPSLSEHAVISAKSWTSGAGYEPVWLNACSGVDKKDLERAISRSGLGMLLLVLDVEILPARISSRTYVSTSSYLILATMLFHHNSRRTIEYFNPATANNIMTLHSAPLSPSSTRFSNQSVAMWPHTFSHIS
jgi:hypothetical protein